MIGVNLRRQDPIHYVRCAGFVREYHDWSIDLAKNPLTPNATPLNPNNFFDWDQGTSGQTEENFGPFYQTIKSFLNYNPDNMKLPPISAVLNHCIPELSGANSTDPKAIDGVFGEFKPVKTNISGLYNVSGYGMNITTTISTDFPAAYLDYADYANQFAKRFGTKTYGSATKKFDANFPTGENGVGYIEIWNEHDKHWFNSRFSGGTNMTQFTPNEYAAMLSASYNGQSETLKASKGIGGTPYSVGSNSTDGDPDIGFVVSGLSDFSELKIPGLSDNYWTYLINTANQFNTLQGTATTAIKFNKAVKAINYHHYSDKVWNDTNLDGGVSPEEDISNGVSFKQRLVKIKTDVVNEPLFSGDGQKKELWLSEFGYDTNKKSAQRAPEIPAGEDDAADQYETQGRYIVRSLLEIAFAGWDRGMVFDLRDANSSKSGGLFDGSGLLKDISNGYQPKKSFYYVSTMKQALLGKTFNKELTDAGYENNFDNPKHPRVYYFADASGLCNKGSLAIWLPTHQNFIYNGGVGDYTIDLTGIDCSNIPVTLIKMVTGDENGVKYKFDLINNKLTIPASFVTERPIFIQLGVDEVDPELACIKPAVTGVACNAVSVSWSPETDFDHYLVYYYEKKDSEEDPTLLGNIPTPDFNINDNHWKLFSDDVTPNFPVMNIIIPGLQHVGDTYFVMVIDVTTKGVTTPQDCLGKGTTTFCEGMIPPKAIIMTDAGVPVTDCLLKLIDNSTINNCNYSDRSVLGEWNQYGYSGQGGYCNHPTESLVFELQSPWVAQTLGLYDASSAGPIQLEYSYNGVNYLPMHIKLTPNNLYFDWYSYESFSYGNWKYFSIPNDPTSFASSPKFIRITKLKFSNYINQQVTFATASIGKVVFYGYKETQDVSASILACCTSSEKVKIIKGNTTVKDEIANLNLVSSYSTMPQEIIIDGTLTIDLLNYGFWQGSKVFMMPGSKIIVGKGNLFNVNASSIVGCDKMWQGIEVENGGKVWYNKSILRDAENAFYLNRSTTVPNSSTLSEYKISNSSLEANLYNLTIPYGAFVNDFNPQSHIFSSNFDGTDNDLKKPYDGQQDWDIKTNYAVKASNITYFRAIGGAGFNQFRRMDFGIDLNNVASVTVNSTVFTDIEERLKQDYIIGNDGVYNPYLTGGIGIKTRNNTNLNFTGTGKLNMTNPSFNSVTTAIDMQFGTFTVKNTRMENVGFGVKNFACREGENYIYDNYIAHRKGGILSGFNNQNGIKIYQNTIVTADNLTAFGISGSGFTNAQDPQVFEIYNNEIRVRNEKSLVPTLGAGIYLTNTKNANLYNNNIRVHNYDLVTTGANEKPKIHGIYLSNSPDNTVCSNNIFGSPFPRGASEGAGRGISLTNSKGNILSCNVVDSLRIGIDIQMNCDAPNKIQGNTVLNNYFGLHVGIPTVNAFTGPQSYTGNKWVKAGNYGFSAINNSFPITFPFNRITLNELQIAGIFTYPLSSGSSAAGSSLYLTFDPPSIFPIQNLLNPDPLNDWIQRTHGISNYLCGEAANISCNNNHLPPINQKEKGILQAVSLGGFYLDDFQKSYAFIIKRSAFSDIKERFVNETVSNEFNEFYQQQLGGAVEKSWIADDLIAKIGKNNPNLLSKIHRLDSFLVKSSVLTDDAEVFYNQDLEIQQTSNSTLIASPLAIEWQNKRDLLYFELNGEIINDIVAASEANNKLNEPDEFIQLERWANDVYLKYFVIPETVNEEVKQKIQDLSDLCPQEAGLGVFKARAMYVILTGSPRPEWDNCFEIEEEKLTEQRESEKIIGNINSIDFLLYPNPTDNTLTIKLLNESIEEVNYQVYNSTGGKIESGFITKGFTQLSTSKFSTGVYYLKVNNKGVNTVKRFIVIR
jgi:Secretion system C-terminal sorting domain